MNLIALAESKGVFLCAAESLTAGRIATEITNSPGSSKVFLGSIVSYTNKSKSGLLAVAPDLLAQRTAVDPEVAIQMAKGARAKFAEANQLNVEHVVAVSATGVAGPESVGANPPGLVFIGVASAQGGRASSLKLAGTRSEIAEQAAIAALALLREELERF